MTIAITFLFYGHTLNYPWKHFDEQIIYNETIHPIPSSISQLIEYVKCFGLNNYFEASNPFYSTISNIRCNPINTLITLITYLFFQKNAFAYHLLSLSLHTSNALLLFLILNKISLTYLKSGNVILRLFLVSVLTFIWALHPVNIESILFAANWAAIVTYFFCLFIFFYCTNIKSSDFSVFDNIIVFILFLIPLLNSEYSITLPIILFFYLYATSFITNKNISHLESLKSVLKKTSPLIILLLLYVFYFLISPTKENVFLSAKVPLQITLERIFWLSPQIFTHIIKLIIFPINLSIDQTMLIEFPKALFNSYSIFCLLFMYLFIAILVISFIFIRQSFFRFLFILFSGFIITLIPFLHIISPTYCLVSERYLYFPTLMLIIGLAHLIFHLGSELSRIPKLVLFISMSTILCSLSIRTYFRTYDWRDSTALFTSALKASRNELQKGIRIQMLGSLLATSSSEEIKTQGNVLIDEGTKILEDFYLKLEEEIQKHQDTLPQILKFYGLDPKTIQAKTAYLLALRKLSYEQNKEQALEILKPHMQDLSITDTQILDMYLGLLFSSNKLDEAEVILNNVYNKKLSPVILIPMAVLQEMKYKNKQEAKKYLQKSFKFFPYDTETLFRLKQYYFSANQANEFALYSYLYGIRTHSKESLTDAYNIFRRLNDTLMAKKSMENIRLIYNP